MGESLFEQLEHAAIAADVAKEMRAIAKEHKAELQQARSQAIDDCIKVVMELLRTQREIVGLTRREAHGPFDKNLMFEKGAADALEKVKARLESLKLMPSPQETEGK